MKNAHEGGGAFLAFRAVLALLLMVGFYGLALGIAFGLLWLVYASVVYGRRIVPKLIVLALAGAFLILKSIVPRRDVFEAPGPQLHRARQPRLFAELQRIAASVGQRMPAEVYLVPDVNAWVSQRGGVMGFGSRRVMGLGLPLLQVLRLSELRAVLAHEFGHYHGGDVGLGPWIYKTRQAIVRTVVSFAQADSLLGLPFQWYAALFFRVTHAISRHQELLADKLAAKVAGGAALARGLRATHAASVAFEPYWRGEVAPVLGAGFLPPLAGGFASFLAQPKIGEALQKSIEEEVRKKDSDPYDTHPSLRERLGALGAGVRTAAPAADDPPALSLIDRLPELEREMLAHVAGADEVRKLKGVAWDEVGSSVYLPHWKQLVEKHDRALDGVTMSTLPALDWTRLRQELALATGTAKEEAEGLAIQLVGSAVGLRLAQAGFSVVAPPGAPVELVHGERRVQPFALRERLQEPEGLAEWARLCDEQDLALTPLGTALR